MGGGSFYGFVFGLDIPSNVTISGMNKVHMRFHKDNTTVRSRLHVVFSLVCA